MNLWCSQEFFSEGAGCEGRGVEVPGMSMTWDAGRGGRGGRSKCTCYIIESAGFPMED